jgi:hypothetical protein
MNQAPENASTRKIMTFYGCGPEGSAEVPTGAEQYPGPTGDNPRGKPEKKGDRTVGRSQRLRVTVTTGVAS